MRWLNKRMPEAKYHRLDKRNIFIFPSRFGFVYLLFVLLIFLLGTNYQNNVIILMSYLMGSLFVSTMLFSFFNIAGISVSCEGKSSGYANQSLKMPIEVFSPGKRYALTFSFAGQQSLYLAVTSIEKMFVELPYFARQRGLINPGRVKIKSEYALGLFVCWTHLDFGCLYTVYPEVKMLKGRLPVVFADKNSSEQSGQLSSGAEDFYELKNYVQGESVNRIAWKQFARGQGKYTKHYQQQQGNSLRLRLADMPATDIETRLQYLCFLVLSYHDKKYQFSLDLGLQQLDVASGDLHLKQCLRALASYPDDRLKADYKTHAKPLFSSITKDKKSQNQSPNNSQKKSKGGVTLS